jgi:hypothetical protein
VKAYETLYKYNMLRVITGNPTMHREKTRTALLSLRVRPHVRQVLARAAQAEDRSMTNMCEVLVLEGCKRRGIVQVQEAPSPRPGTKEGKRTRAKSGLARPAHGEVTLWGKAIVEDMK